MCTIFFLTEQDWQTMEFNANFILFLPSLFKLWSSYNMIPIMEFWNSYSFKSDRNSLSICTSKDWIDKMCKTLSFTYIYVCNLLT